jgi:hypothetical protein
LYQRHDTIYDAIIEVNSSHKEVLEEKKKKKTQHKGHHALYLEEEFYG